MVQGWAVKSSARLSTWKNSWRSRVLLEILHDTEVGAVEFYSNFYMVQMWDL